MPLLHWLNKDTATQAAAKSAYRLLEEVPVLSYGDAHNENLLIQGDNLEALKALIPFYAGKVKCIFIDPPYNTQSAFEHYDDNLEHSQWLSLMYPRLELLRELLSEDGSIWVTIDDNEAHYLKVIMDEVFGRRNFVANVVWQKKYTVANDAKWFSVNHDHNLSYAKNKEKWLPNKLERTNQMDKAYKNPDNHTKGPWKSTPLHAKSGVNTMPYEFKEGVVWRPPAGTYRRYSDEAMKEMEENDQIWFGKTGKSIPSRKTFLSELKSGGATVRTVWLHNETGHNHEAKDEVKKINGVDVFDTPKPEKLLQRIIHISTNENDLVLDSFLGSGTTAAVAHKMKRRFIGIELGDHAQTHCQPRLKKVVDGEQGGISKAVNWQGGGGFRFCKLGVTVFDALGMLNHDIKFTTLAAHIWYMETRQPLAKPSGQSQPTALLGINNDTAYYLLYNDILGDKRPHGGNVLTSKVLAILPPFEGKKVIYGETTRLGQARLTQENITFKQIPYDVKAL